MTYCKHSTLREVYAAVSGLPDVVSPDEFGALRARFSREWPNHEFSSIQLLLPPDPASLAIDPQAVVSPSWFAQMSFDERRWFGRWGHRTVGLHRVVTEGERYVTFTRTMRPTLDRWLGAAADAYAFAGVDPPVGTLVFGYVNAFTLDGAIDLSEWFRFNFAIDAAGVGGGLSEIAVAARIPRPEAGARAAINLNAQQDDSSYRVTVHTFVEQDAPEGLTFTQAHDLSECITRAKVLARDTFFSFVTERTLEHMGATDGPEPAT